jgi:hypothetical protein
MDFPQFLTKVKSEAYRLCADDPALPLIDAYERALTVAFMTAAEEQTVTPFEEKLLHVMKRLHDDHKKALGFRNGSLVAALNLDGMSVNRHTLRETLVSLEQRGLVNRPRGKGSRLWTRTAD